MTDEATLRAAVLQAPDDDAPRLAYAQWCDGNGDPARAELIRLQIQLANTPRDILDSGRAAGMQYDEQRLLAAHASRWTAAIAPWIARAHFLRGFVGFVELSATQFLAHIDALLAHEPILHVDLTAVRDVDETLFDHPAWARMRSLSMDDCGLYDVHVQLLAASPHMRALRWLSLARNHLTLAAAEAIAQSPYLRQLALAEFRFNPVDPAELIGRDSGIIVASWMPEPGQQLEARFGPLPWLHRTRVPSRF